MKDIKQLKLKYKAETMQVLERKNQIYMECRSAETRSHPIVFVGFFGPFVGVPNFRQRAKRLSRR